MQMQFLAALYPRTTDTTRKSKILTELGVLLDNALVVSTPSYEECIEQPGVPMVLIALTLMRKGSVYANMGPTRKNQIDGLLNNYYSSIGSALNTHRNSTKFASEETNTQSYKIASFSLNIPLLCAGALGISDDLVKKNNQFVTAISAYVSKAIDMMVLSNSQGFIAIGGGKSSRRRPYGSTGYNSYTGMGLSLAAHGIVKTGSLLTPSNGGSGNTYSRYINNFYKSAMQANQYARMPELSKHKDFNATVLTEAQILAYNEQMILSGVVINPSGDNTQDLVQAQHVNSTVYLANLLWNVDTSFISVLQQHLIRTGEATGASSSISALRAACNTGSTETKAQVANRVVCGFAGLLERGITTI